MMTSTDFTLPIRKLKVGDIFKYLAESRLIYIIKKKKNVVNIKNTVRADENSSC